MFDIKNTSLAVIGLGYVGLPLAVEFSKKIKVLGFDINEKRINELKNNNDQTLEIKSETLKNSKNLTFTCDIDSLCDANVYIVTVPTPIDAHKKPDLKPLLKVSKMLGKIISPGDLIVYESTVYPGVTEEECVPILEKFSNLKLNVDFFVGYSPERINPGDKNHTVSNITKVVSGSTSDVTNFLHDLYSEIVSAGVFKAGSIQVAEAAKVIENTQRDVNIALVNELAIIFNKLGIDTSEVLKAAGTKWNFLPFNPGLVGGHCIGVDPYYLTYKAQSIGYHPEVILAGRRINDGMGEYVAAQLVKQMIKNKINVDGSKVLVLGLTFKENCPDLRNTKVIDVITELKNYKIQPFVVDPWCSTEEAKKEYNLTLTIKPKKNFYDAIILAVAHDEFKKIEPNYIKSLGKENCVIYDLKNTILSPIVDIRL